MSRKNLLTGITASITEENNKPQVSEARSDYTRRGASKSMMHSLDDLAEMSMRIREGDVVVMLDPELIDGSFVGDRIGDDLEAYLELKTAIQTSGQSSPILVRPHPDVEGRYQTIFGHRRAKVAKELGIKVKAVIKQMADIEHVIAQGQENSARADLSFIEKSLFAKGLIDRGMSRDVVKTALTVDDTLLSRMLAVAETVPAPVLNALGSAKGIGRDRWEDLKKVTAAPSKAEQAVEFVATQQFIEAGTVSDAFALLVAHLKISAKARKPSQPKNAGAWTHASKAVTVESKAKSKGFSLELTEKDAKPFGQWITHNLDDLYESFRKSQASNGD